jgi:hypothetical protein
MTLERPLGSLVCRPALAHGSPVWAALACFSLIPHGILRWPGSECADYCTDALASSVFRGWEPSSPADAMAEYRVYIIGAHGRIMSRIDIECADDDAAIEAAMQHVGSHYIELWQRGRLVTKLDRKPK